MPNQSISTSNTSPLATLSTAAETQKSASISDLSPMQLLALSTLLGGGAYGATRAVRSFKDEIAPTHEEPGTLVIKVPKNTPTDVGGVKVANAQEAAKSLWEKSQPHLAKIIAVAGGIPAGYVGAGALYQHFKNQEQEAELKKSHDDYLNLLQTIQAKTASVKTPLVDEFCEGLSKAAEENIGYLRSILRNVPVVGSGVNVTGAVPEGHGSSFGNAGQSLLARLPNLMPGNTNEYVIPILSAVGLGAGVMSYKAMKALEKKDAPMDDRPPRKVKLEYV